MAQLVYIRRPRPLPRQGRRLGPPEVWNLALGSQAKAHAIKATPLSATCPRHLHAPAELLHLHAPGRSRLPFARPQTLQTLPQASKATTLTATTCPCHLFFRGFKTAVCPPSNPPNASNAPAGLQGNNSYSYMPLPSVFQGVQDCRLPALKPPKRFQRSRRPPRQQLLQLHVPKPSKRFQPSRRPPRPSHLFFRGSRLPFARPQTPQTLPTLPQPPRQQLLQLHVLKPSKRFQPSRRPPRQQLLQLHAPAICFSGGSRLPFARPQTLQTLPTLSQASKATTLTATCPTLPQASKATTLTATCPCHLFFRGFKTAVCPAPNPPNASNPPAGLQGNNSYSYMPLPSVFQGVQDCRLPALKPPKRFQRSRRPPRQQLLQLHVPAICFSGGSRLPSQAQRSKLPFARPQTLQTLPALPQASKATTLTATCPCHLFFRGFKTAVCPPSNPPNASNAPAGLQGNNSYSYMSLPSVFQGFKTAVASKGTRNVCPASNPPNASARLQGNNSYSYYMPLPSVFQGVQDCRLPALKPPKRFQRSRRPPRQQLLQLHAPAICFSRGSRLRFARPQTSQTLLTLPQASKATTLTATCPCHLFFRGFKTAVCPPSNPPNASNAPAGLQGNNSYSYMSLPSVFQGVQHCRRKQRHTPSRQHLCQLHAQPTTCSCRTLTPTCPCHLFFRTFKTTVCPASNPPNASAGLQGNNSYSYMSLPQTPQTLPTLPQASKATTLTAKCPCHLFFRGFKTAVCPPSNPPNASNAPAGLQGNNSYSYMSLPSVFQGVQDCRLLGLKPPKRFQPSRRPPRQQLLQLHVPAICFSGGSRLPFARPQTPQTLPTLPQASKATTLTATCPCHLFFRTFKTAVCPASNRPNASAGLQGNNSYSYFMPLPSVFQGVQDCRLPGLKPPKPEPVIHRLLWGFCCGTNHFVFLHGFPAGVSWLT